MDVYVFSWFYNTQGILYIHPNSDIGNMMYTHANPIIVTLNQDHNTSFLNTNQATTIV